MSCRLGRMWVALALLFVAVEGSKNLETMEYDVYPRRHSEEAAVIEWGHSAVISAIDACVASFGPQTSRGAFFEVEAAPILASPIDGNIFGKPEGDNAEVKTYVKDMELKPLDNAEEIHGNMVVMSNAGGLSGVLLAAIAKKSGAGALMVVNVDPNHPDLIERIEPVTEDEEEFAKEIDFPVVMVSYSSAGTLTSGGDESSHGMPDRVRLYAGGDRPFFEDVVSQNPTVYLIHNLLSSEECDALVAAAEGKFDLIDSNNLLEDVATPGQKKQVERAHLWKGKLASHSGQEVEERIEQVTAFPKEHFSDFVIYKYSGEGSYLGPHFDEHPSLGGPMATLQIFLNDVEDGGEVVFPSSDEDDQLPVKIAPLKGLAIVHHNTDENYLLDPATIHADLPLKVKGGFKYVAKKYVYTLPVQPSRRIMMPLVAGVCGGKLPQAIILLHNLLLEKFGAEKGTLYFDKLCLFLPALVLMGLGSFLATFLQGKNTKVEEKKGKAKKAGTKKKQKPKSS
eukprot:CAMPEP_0198291306 /NCGR_PEP_ID=MMETSP1449-20131203/8876_1 /TAXON_ID=420275 /ORGANISM="Attheya septentrionalis, Strain CCMP2084" /LENGTH=508 /DNA_ID=CAMNT_0043989923 /DNA_START=118 /DNA_END=1644 /DNA_ORIENTATION=-